MIEITRIERRPSPVPQGRGSSLADVDRLFLGSLSSQQDRLANGGRRGSSFFVHAAIAPEADSIFDTVDVALVTTAMVIVIVWVRWATHPLGADQTSVWHRLRAVDDQTC